jgi:mannosyltransferase OCH1-like enzyme
MVPKFIHQIGPKNLNHWHPIWFDCQKSIKENFKDFKYFFWNDEEDLYNFIKKNNVEFLNLYESIDLQIIKIDLTRLLILYYYGGIYLDLDIFCFQNFFNELKEENVLEGNLTHEKVHNAIIAVKPKSDYIKQCIHTFKENYLKEKNYLKFSFKVSKYRTPGINEFLVNKISGPMLLSEVIKKFKNINILKKQFYHGTPFQYNKNLKTKHMLTGIWGKECYENMNYNKNLRNLNHLNNSEYFKLDYLENRGIDLDSFNYYKNYE